MVLHLSRIWRDLRANCGACSLSHLGHKARSLFWPGTAGIKPLYYTCAGDTLIFASEVKAILEHPGVEARLNLQALPHYLTFQYFPDPEAAFAGIYRLRPAHHLTLDSRGLKIKKYWTLRFNPEPKPLKHLVEMTDHLLQEALRLHLTSDVPRGAFLSSGIDSSNIVALLSRQEEVNTYSVGCAGGRYDELPTARETARFLGTRHREITVDAATYWSALPRILWHQEEPVADPAAVALYFVAGLAAADVKVVLSGEGRMRFSGIRNLPGAAPWRGAAPAGTCAKAASGSRRPPARPYPRKNFLRRATTPLEKRYFGNACIFNEAEKTRSSIQSCSRPAGRFMRDYRPTSKPASALTIPRACSTSTFSPGCRATFWPRLTG